MGGAQENIRQLIYFQLGEECCERNDDFQAFGKASAHKLQELGWEVRDLNGHLRDEIKCYTPDMSFSTHQAAILYLGKLHLPGKRLADKIECLLEIAFQQLNFANCIKFEQYAYMTAHAMYNAEFTPPLPTVRPVNRQIELARLHLPTPLPAPLNRRQTSPSPIQDLCDAIQGGNGPCVWV